MIAESITTTTARSFIPPFPSDTDAADDADDADDGDDYGTRVPIVMWLECSAREASHTHEYACWHTNTFADTHIKKRKWQRRNASKQNIHAFAIYYYYHIIIIIVDVVSVIAADVADVMYIIFVSA